MGLLIPELKSYFKPSSLTEAVSLVNSNHPKTRILAGGTSLAFGNPAIETVIDISGLDLKGWSIDSEGNMEIGALTTIHDLELIFAKNPYAGSFMLQACDHLASTPLRNLITIGGNLLTGYVWADLPVALLAVNAKFKICNGQIKIREITENDSFQKSAFLSPHELLTHIILPANRKDYRAAFIKFAQTEVDFSICSVAVSFQKAQDSFQNIRIACGGIVAKPQRLIEVEALLEGKRNTPDILDYACRIVFSTIVPRPDSRGSSEYRKQILCNLIKRAIECAWGESRS
jgi:xanthine dehydrogenase FAD-binding subunit